MARHRRMGKRGSFRGFARRAKRSVHSGGRLTPMGAIIGGATYGAARQLIANFAKPLTSNLGAAGQYAEPAVLGVIDYFAATKGSGIIRDAGIMGLGIEAAGVAHSLVGNSLGSMAGQTGQASYPSTGYNFQ